MRSIVDLPGRSLNIQGVARQQTALVRSRGPLYVDRSIASSSSARLSTMCPQGHKTNSR